MSGIDNQAKFKKTMIQVQKLNEYFAKECKGDEDMDIICLHIAAALHHGVLTEIEYQKFPKLIEQLRKLLLRIENEMDRLKEEEENGSRI